MRFAGYRLDKRRGTIIQIPRSLSSGAAASAHKIKVANKKAKPFHLCIGTQAVNGVSIRVGKG